jgi:cold-inducible RNA-binding protein
VATSGDRNKLSKKLYVGNLSFDATETQVRDLFAEYGEIESLAMITDRDSGRFRGFCFVEMEPSAANAAINALNGKIVDDRDLRVNEAKPREDRSGGGRQGGGNRNNRRNDYPNSGGGRRW